MLYYSDKMTMKYIANYYNILVVLSARETALAWAVAQAKAVSRVDNFVMVLWCYGSQNCAIRSSAFI